MKNINITVKNKRAVVEGGPVIVCGNSDYTLTFTFDAEWTQSGAKTARFVYTKGGEIKHEDVVFMGNTVAVPVLSDVAFVKVGVFEGDLCTTTPARIACETSILCGAGAPHDPTPDVYNQIMEMLNNMTAGGTFGATEEQAQQIRENKQSIDDLVAGTKKAGDANKLEGHGADYFVSKGEVLNTSILEKALTVAEGVAHFKLGRGNYTGGDLPDTKYAYGMATVFRSSANGITVVLYCGRYKMPLAVTQHNGTAWLDWDLSVSEAKLNTVLEDYVTRTDFAEIDGTQSLNTSILEKANELPRGVYEFVLGGSSYTGEDLPNSIYRYSTAEVSTKGPTVNKSVVIRGIVNNGSVFPPIINYFTGESWSGWHTYVVTKDGAVESASNTPFKIRRTSADNTVFLQFLGKSGILGSLGFLNADEPIFRPASGNGIKKLLHEGNYSDYALPKTGGNVDTLTIENNTAHHDGNSAKVHIGTSAPSDTSSLWIDTSE